MEDGASFAPAHPPPMDANIPLAGEPYGPRMGSRAVVAFRACLPDTYDGSTLPYRLGNWLHQLESIFLLCDFDTTEWTGLAVIQLVGEAMEWWRTIGTLPRETSWQTFCYDITHRFPVDEPPVATPLAMPASPSPQPAISFTTARLTVMRVLRWKAREGEELESYLQRFIHEIVNASPIPLTEEEQCFHFWQGLPEQVRARVYAGTRLSFDHLVSEIYYVEMGLQEERRAEEERRELDQRTEARHQKKELQEDKHMRRSTTFGTVDPHKGKAKAGTSHIYIDSDEDDDPVEFQENTQDT